MKNIEFYSNLIENMETFPKKARKFIYIKHRKHKINLLSALPISN